MPRDNPFQQELCAAFLKKLTITEGAVNLKSRLLAGALAAAGVGLAPFSESRGSGFQLRENSASALGNAFAGAAASAEDPSIIANNPAAMTELSGNQVSGDISIVVPSAVFSGMGLSATRRPIDGGNSGDAGSAQPVPAAYGLYDASPDLKFGLAISAPFGLETQYDSGWVGRYQAIKSDIETININPNIAYRVSEWLSIGGGPAIQRAHTELTNAINSTTVAHLASPLLPAGFTLPDGSARATGDSLSVGYTLGLLAVVSPGTRLGASYRSQVSHRIEGTATFNVPAALTTSPVFQNTPARVDLKTPDVVSLAASHEISPEVTLLAEVQWTNWSVVKNLRIERPDGSALIDQPEQWHGTWFGSVGATYRPDPSWIIRGGLAFDPTPVGNQFRTARLPDSDRYWLSLGLGYRMTSDIRFDAAYVHIFVANPSINEVSQTGDLLTGRYSGHVDIVSLSATLRF
jgi:long-chain fatty acid transport protein